MNVIDTIYVELKPTVTIDIAQQCCGLLNLFLADNEEYKLCIRDGELRLKENLNDTRGSNIQLS